jgi:hypothetical protein
MPTATAPRRGLWLAVFTVGVLSSLYVVVGTDDGFKRVLFLGLGLCAAGNLALTLRKAR